MESLYSNGKDYHVIKYTDSVELYAGYLTPLVAWWTLYFYKHRQKKWQKITKNL